MCKNRKIQLNLSEALYLIFFSIMLFAKGLGLYDGQLLYKLAFVVSFGCLALKMCITKYTKMQWIVISIVSLGAGGVYLISREKGILICLMMVIALKDVCIQRVFKTGMWIWAASMLGNLLYHLIFLEQSGYKVHEKLGLGHIFRWSLGQSHPNILHISYFVLTVFLIYNWSARYDWKKLLLLMAGNAYIFIYSVSYTGFFIVTLFLVGSLYVNIRKKITKLEYFLVEMVFPTCLGLSFLPPLILDYSSKWFYYVNAVFNNRLYLAYVYLIPENIKLFGNNLAEITTSMYTLDNAYLFNFIIYGVFVFCLMVVAYLIVIHKYVKEEKKMELAIIVCFLIAGITEPFLFNTSFKNLTLLFVGDCLLNFGKGKKEYSVFSKVEKKLEINVTKFIEIAEKIIITWKNKKTAIIFGGLGIGIICLVLVVLCYKQPTGYMMPRKHVDIAEKNWVFIENIESYEEQGYIVYDYGDQKTMMQIFEGNIVKVEFMRQCVSALIVGSLMGSGLITIILSSKRTMFNKK